MSMKLSSLNINRNGKPQTLQVGIADETGQSVHVRITVAEHEHLDALTLGEIEQRGHQAAKALHP
ncbi:hypothetical protein LMG28688_01603 [Paraburkholderia caffeinitolerans]|uniref:Uncharacterized protein n=1 Tax=Paraburkholderia caffeinitolerans TaxID=1723730 RepID=A0A6J5FQF6_9BURK|nr:hypothetical protein [Paraburkholderia caffeinitolerans]CAB3783218.1 hypothetical protein LMG28688_01603 [Paraburkholderia caffeinitolerans]